LRALVIGEEWGQLYVSNFFEILTLFREGGINFLGVFQNAAAQIESRYGRETARIWKKAVAMTLYRGLPIQTRSKTSSTSPAKRPSWLRGFSVNNQVNGSGDNLAEQSRPLLQVEDIRRDRRRESAAESRDHSSPSMCLSSGTDPNYPACSATCAKSPTNTRVANARGSLSAIPEQCRRRYIGGAG
jgi:type IV secretion system protein VirD4